MRAPHRWYRLAQWLSVRLPPPLAFGLAERLADAHCRGSWQDRAAVASNLALAASGSRGPDAASVREVFRNFGRYLVEFLSIHAVHRPCVSVTGEEHLLNIQRRGQAAIILTGHVGNWELGAILLHRMGFPISVIALPHRDPQVNRLFNHQRERCGLEVIPVGPDAAHLGLRSLRGGRLLGILGDREFGDQGVAVPWLGGTVRLPRGPAVLSLRSQRPILPTFLIREGPWRFRLHVEPPIWPTGDATQETTVPALTSRYAEVLAQYVRRFPEQWLMFQPIAAPGAAA